VARLAATGVARPFRQWPRTDAEDVTEFVYYPVDSSVPALLRGHLAATKDAAGQITRYETYDVFGNPTRVIDANDVATELTFDLLGRSATTTIKGIAGCNTAADPLCATDLTSTRTYAPLAGPLAREDQPRGGVTSYTYDSRGRIRTVSRGPAPTDLRERIDTSYGASGKKALERTLAFEGGDWVEKTREAFAYDAESRLQTIMHADGATMHYDYDHDGRIASVRDERHAAPNTFYTYDIAGRLSTVTQTLAGAPAGVIATSYDYDVHGNMTLVTDPNGNVTAYVHDDFGQMVSQQSPVTGTTTYAYDSAGNLTQTTDANGATTTRTHDASNRILTSVSARSGTTETVSWRYDGTGTDTYGIGRVATMDDPSGITSYAYDRRGLVRQENRTIRGSTYVQGYGYDADGNRTSIGYPSGRVVTYAHDYAGRPTAAAGTHSGQTTSYVTAAMYLPFGPMKSLSLGNGTVETRTYNSRYLPLTNTLTAGLIPLAQYTYTTDPAGNITGIIDHLDAGYSRTSGYDDLNRLTSWNTTSFTYDRMGNMLAGGGRSFTYQGSTPKISSATGLETAMTYDAAGNELKSPAGDPGWPAAVYSPRNLLESQFVRAFDRCYEEHGSACIQPDPAEEWLSHVYDGRGVRVLTFKNIVSGSIGPEPEPEIYFYTPELSMLNVISRSTSRTADVIWFGGRPVADHDATAVRYTFTDHLGTPILQTTAAGFVVWRIEYTPFGEVHALRAGEAADDQPLRFPGQQVAFATPTGEENYNIFRWYRAGGGGIRKVIQFPRSGPVTLKMAV